MEQKRFAEVAALWTDAKNARAFADSIKSEGELRRVEVIKPDPGPLEGAAGSVYTTVFVSFYYYPHKEKIGHVALRRVNDVPGSTEAQRRWRIERIGFDWKGA